MPAVHTGCVLLILPEGVIGIAHCWPFAVTVACGKLHGINPKPSDTLANFAASFSIADGDITAAADLARALGFGIDPAISDLLARVG